jgi:hypothetical protein
MENPREVKAFFMYESRIKRTNLNFDRKQLMLEMFNKDSIKALEHRELIKLIDEMKRSIYEINVKEIRQRRKVIALFCQMEYVSNKKADMERINAWCVKYGHKHKELNDYYGAELTALVSQVEKVYSTFINSAFKVK